MFQPRGRAKIGWLFREMQKKQIESLKTQGFWGSQEVRNVSKPKQIEGEIGWAIFSYVISDLGSLIRNSLTRAVRMISEPNEVSELGN